MMALPKNYYKYTSYPKCKVCGKISYPSQERAMYAALIIAVTFGTRIRAYRKQNCFYSLSNMETWHISSRVSRAMRNSTIDEKERIRRNKENKRQKARKQRKRLRLGLTRKQAGL